MGTAEDLPEPVKFHRYNQDSSITWESGPAKDVPKIRCIIDMWWQSPVRPRTVLRPVVDTCRNNPTTACSNLSFYVASEIHVKETSRSECYYLLA